jgi:predicted GNAT family N-acyltransferase
VATGDDKQTNADPVSAEQADYLELTACDLGITGAYLEVLPHEWARAHEGLELCYRVLLEPFGVSREAPWDHVEPRAEHVVAFGDAEPTDEFDGSEAPLLGYARLLPADADGFMQLRQVAVVEAARGLGIGRALVRVAERRALEEGAVGLWLNARLSAVQFYERLGYAVFSEEFVTGLANLPHVRMRRRLGE